MQEIARIQKMEQALDDVSSAQKALAQALENFSATQCQLSELSDYYGSKDYFHDLELDEQGQLPATLKRGVLSEDAVYDLITSIKEMALEMQKVAEFSLNHIKP